MSKVAVIVVAAGKGERFGGAEKKTFAKIGETLYNLIFTQRANYLPDGVFFTIQADLMIQQCG